MKTVAVPAGAAAEFSTEILIGDVEAQSRWGLGSLCASVLSKSVIPLLVAIRSSTQGVATLMGVDSADFDLTDPLIDGDLVIEREAGTSKSRRLLIDSPVVALQEGLIQTLDTVAFDPNNPRDALVESLLLSPRPSFTLLGVMNKMESFLDNLPPGWGVVIDQSTEKIHFFSDSTTESVLFAAIDAAAKIVSFTLTADEIAETVPGYGWE